MCKHAPILYSYFQSFVCLLEHSDTLLQRYRCRIRELRQATLNFEEVLKRISLTRISRAYQIPSLLKTIPQDRPIVIANVLSIFRQEEIADYEAHRLMTLLLDGIQAETAPIIFVERAPIRPEDETMFALIKEAADHRFEPLPEPPEPDHQLSLFGPYG